MSKVLPPELAARTRGLSDEAIVVVFEAFRQGRHVGYASAREQIEAFVNMRLEELEHEYEALTPAMVASLEASFQVASSSGAVAAHFGGAADALWRILHELRRLERRNSGSSFRA